LHYFVGYTKLNSDQCAEFDKVGTGGPLMECIPLNSPAKSVYIATEPFLRVITPEMYCTTNLCPPNEKTMREREREKIECACLAKGALQLQWS
jgi:hypothetical protein